MKKFTYIFSLNFIFLISIFAEVQIQLAFAGESTKEVIQILRKSPSLALKKSIIGNASEVSLQDLLWYIKDSPSAVYLPKEKLRAGMSYLKVKKKPNGLFYIHVLRITPPNKIDLIASFKVIQSSTFSFDAKAKDPLMSFSY